MNVQQPGIIRERGNGRAVAAWLIVYASVLTWSFYKPKELFTWWLEVAPALVALLVLIATRRRFPLTPLVYILILIHCIILMVGGHYTYAEVPLFDWFKDILGWQRNNYDKLGHFAQGLVPALVAREIFIRRNVVRGLRWTNFLVIAACLAISAMYELIEWWVAELSGTAAEAFLGTQGYAWDTQSDMLWALFGALTATLFFSRLHDRQLRSMPRSS